jgi:Acetyltransferase (GNAT) family
MAIRFATLQDVPGMVALGSRMHQLTRFKHLDYLPAKVTASLTHVVHQNQNPTQQKHVCLVALDATGAVVGMLLAVLEQHIFSEQLTASIMYYIVLPEKAMGGYGVRLMKAFEQWSKNRKVVEIGFGINSINHTDELARLGSFARKLGYGKVGENYVRTL